MPGPTRRPLRRCPRPPAAPPQALYADILERVTNAGADDEYWHKGGNFSGGCYFETLERPAIMGDVIDFPDVFRVTKRSLSARFARPCAAPPAAPLHRAPTPRPPPSRSRPARSAGTLYLPRASPPASQEVTTTTGFCDGAGAPASCRLSPPAAPSTHTAAGTAKP